MSTQKAGSFKVPPLDRVHYNLWKKKMTLFINASNSLYVEILHNGPYVSMKTVPESTSVEGVRILPSSTLKDPTRYTDADKELIRLNTSLQFIIVEATINDMSYQIMGCDSAKEM